ncbi:MAG: CHASE2 domain-containing protein, partial [Terriglobia bacterium]
MALVLASAAAGLVLSWVSFGLEFDKYAYDFLFRLEQPKSWQPGSIILAIDERTLSRYGGMTHVRAALADGLEKIRGANPAAVAVDMILAEPGASEAEDRGLEAAFAATPRLVLACYLLGDKTWEVPIERFRRHAFALGHVHADFDKYDAVSRDIPLEVAAGRERHWALALETFRAVRGGTIVESPDDLMLGSIRIPSSMRDQRVMRIRYLPVPIPTVTVAELDTHPELAARFQGKAVFAGVTAQAAGDRWLTPYSNTILMPGIEMNANEYETLAQQQFLVDVSPVAVVAVCIALAIAAGLIYAFLEGRAANYAALALALISQVVPAAAFSQRVVWPWLPGTAAVLLAIAMSAGWRHLIVRRELADAGQEKNRYQRAMQFVTHEMRTPLTAIQGSSELISRYGSMPEVKRQQMADLINSESKRLARMIETFLSVERLSAGEMELKREKFPLAQVVESCAQRARPLAERKNIELEIAAIPANDLTGDRELMEYAVYNLLTNAVKYSPPATTIRVFGENDDRGGVHLSIEDQGIGMDKKEVSRIFEKFYRTRRAEQSGEMGTGIGLSIVEQIVREHGGTIHVESEPGKGSRFTL